MRRILNGLSSRWILSAFGLFAAGSMVWLFGPFTSLLEGALPRVAALGLMSFIWILANGAIDHMRRRTDARLTAGVTQVQANAGAEDVEEQRERLTRAMRLLRAARGTRGYLYEQPWYVIIGPPGAGKSTALANAGLRFPLAAELEGGEIRGVGGTRYCDWSFTDEAVLIDTAGRYTTQDSDAQADKAGWEGFLELLRRTRPRQPLNGVIVAISVTDIALAPETERRAHARAIRARVKELYTKLGVRIPVYAMFTKFDLIQGFTDFFDDLDRERRAQVWGTTFALETGHAGPAGEFAGEFRALTARLSDRLVDRLQVERSPERRAAIADFPNQFASLEAPLAAFVDDAFAGTRLDPAPFLRGIYFASGTQDGNPIDRLTGTLARSFGIDQRQVAASRPTQGRGYFLETLLKDVVFGEAMLLVHNPRAARRRLLVRGAAWMIFGLVMLGGIGALWFIQHGITGRVERFESGLDAYHKAVERERLDPVPVGASDLPHVKPLLDQARALRATTSEASYGIWDLGLSQRDKLSLAADSVYRGALERILLPRLISIVEARMRAPGTDLDYLFRTTRVYLILCGEGLMDRPMVKDWMQSDWANQYRGESAAPFRADLAAHLDALLSKPLERFPYDQLLLQQSQARLSQISVGARAYALLRSSAAARTPHPFVPAEAIGAAMARKHFVRTSGKDLNDPIPGLFTLDGYRTAILPNMARTTELAVRESWVVGKESKIDPTDVIARQRVEHEVLDLYAKDYQTQWDGLLGTLEMVPPKDSASAVADFSMLTAPQGPIRRLLMAMVPNLDLAEPPAAPQAPGGQAAALVPPQDSSIAGLDDHYRELREFVTSGRIDSVLQSVDRLQQQIASTVAASAGAGGAAVTPGMDAAQALSKAAADAPAPVSRWLQTLARRGGTLRDETSRQHANAAYSGPGGALPLCQQVVQRFPFRLAARDDVPMASFADLFAPNGRFDSFFTQFVRPFVDTTVKAWGLRDPVDTQAPVAASGLAQFQRAQMIRDTFFTFGGNQPRLRFALRPSSLDAGMTQVTFDFGGFTESWTPSSTGAKAFDWPGPTGMADVRVTFAPLGTGPDLQQLGPWALFRLLNQAKLERIGGGESYTLTLRQGDRAARFNLSAGTGHSPFDFDLFTGFRCPELRP